MSGDNFTAPIHRSGAADLVAIVKRAAQGFTLAAGEGAVLAKEIARLEDELREANMAVVHYRTGRNELLSQLQGIVRAWEGM